MMFKNIKIFFYGTLRSRLILNVALIHAIMMTIFIGDLTLRQRAIIIRQQEENIVALSHSLSTNATEWVAANDLAGLQELIDAEDHYPEIAFAIITNNSGRILAHTDKSKVGQRLLELPANTQQTIVHKTSELIDALAPVMIDGKQIGWVRIGLGQKEVNKKLDEILVDGILYTLAAIIIGSLLAWIIGTRITKRLYIIQQAIDEVAKGNTNARSIVSGTDEAAQLSKQFNEMLDVRIRARMELNEKTKLLEDYKYALDQSAITAITDEKGIIRSINDAFCKISGYSNEELVGNTHDILYSGYHPQEFYDDLVKTISSGKIWTGEFKNKTKDGNFYWTDATIIPFLNTDNKPYQYLTIQFDITKRKNAEESLYIRNEHAQSLLRLSKKLELSQTYEDVLDVVRTEVESTIGYQSVWVYMFSEDKKCAKILTVGGTISNAIMQDERVATLVIKGDRMLEEIAEAKGIVVVEDARTDERTNKEIVAKLGNRTIVNVPIILNDKHLGTVGTGTFGEEGIRVPTKYELEFLAAMASHLAVTLDRIHLLNERKKNEELIKEKSIQLEMLSNNLPGSMIYQGVRDENGKMKFTYISEGIKKLSDKTPEEIVGDASILYNLTYEEDRQKVIDADTISFRYMSEFNVDIRYYHPSGEIRWAQVHSTPRKMNDGEVIWDGIYFDITERKKMEQALIEDEQILNTVFEKSPIGKEVYDKNFVLIKANKKVDEIFGTDASSLIGIFNLRNDPNYNNPEIWEKIEKGIRVEHEIEFDFNKVAYPTKKRGIAYLQLITTPISNEVSKNIGCIIQVIDITEKKQYEHKISKAIIKTQEDERYEIGGELHDNVCQILVAAQMGLGMLNKNLTANDTERLEESKRLVGTAIDDLRNLSHRLAPVFYSVANLEESFKKLIYTYHFSKHTKTSLRVDIDEEKYNLHPQLQLNLYRILQEQLNNIYKYANATIIDIDLKIVNSKLRMIIMDNGIGFDMNAHSDGIGFANMRRRVEIFSGKFEILSSPENGCLIRINIPVEENIITDQDNN